MGMFDTDLKRRNGLALKALADAKSLKAKFDEKGEWEGDDYEQWNRANQEFAEQHKAIQQLQKDEQQYAMTEDLRIQYETAQQQNPLIASGAEKPMTFEEKRLQARLSQADALRRYLLRGEPGLNQKELTKYVMQRPAEEEMAMLSPQVRMALSAIVGDRGGFAIQDVFMDELVKDLAGFAVIRPNARVRQVPGMAALFLTIASGTDPYPSGLSGSWRSPDWLVDGALPPVQNQPTFGRERVPLHMWAPDAVVIPLELLESSAVELEQEIRMLFAETKALDEDSGFINGTGVNSPMGVVTDAANALITTVNSGAANGQSYTGILDLYTALPAQYRMRARWLMNSLTYGLLLQLETTGGMVLFPPNTLPNTLWTRPVDFSEFMPDGNADGNHAVIFGDWSHYAIGDRTSLRFIRLTERFVPNIGLMAIGFTGGQVLKTAAFRAQTVGA